MLKIETAIIAKSPARSGLPLGTFLGVTIHETGNASASATAKNHAVYLNGSGKSQQVSYHYAVDNLGAYHLIPDNEIAWHAGDGAKGEGNTRTLAIEICVNADAKSEARKKAVENAAELAAKLLKERGFTAAAGRIFQHHDFSPYGKNCPADIRAGKPVNWEEFCRMVDEFLAPAALSGITDERQSAADTLYRVQVGAFKSRENAQKYADELKQMGVIGFVREA
ncbi:MAG: N-acetylmuramoyl-L-alanine amidase [Oscillospiraceae bacterium]|nr:N-acetylmuramoyl-L-alanine amidase [Oscillospiraceae bacterium]